MSGFTLLQICNLLELCCDEQFRLVHHLLDLFSARERIRPEFIFFMNGISDIFFEGSFRMGCCVLFLIVLKVFLQYELHHRAGVKPARQHHSTAADLR